MDEWVLWLIAAVAFGGGEVLTTGFFLAPFAIGALVAALVSVAGGGFVLAGLAFLIVSTAALIGRQATVLERVSGAGGAVKLEGEIWSAKPYDEDDVIEPGTRVHVLEIRGATALVSE
jgi:membrane protein implicated in regulation of membrane protease activity